MTRYITHSLPIQKLDGQRSSELLVATLEELVDACPPKASYAADDLAGLFLGYSSLAVLFLQLSELRPELSIKSRRLRHWAEEYTNGEREVEPVGKETGCGLVQENLCHKALKACLSGDSEDIQKFLELIESIPCDDADEASKDFPSEILYGRAGSLYLMRLVTHWVPSSNSIFEPHVARISAKIMRDNDDGKLRWTWLEREYIGAAHGDIGIITQLVRSTPTLAPKLSNQLKNLIELQLPDGNWPKFANEKESELVQWCHGAPGFVICLKALRPYFPDLEEQIDVAIEKGEQSTWEKGLLRKYPNLCHGIFGNAL